MKFALVLGSADCLFHDVQHLAAWAYVTDPVIIAVNDAGWLWPDSIDHWVTLHPEHFDVWERRRRRNAGPGIYKTWGPLHKSEPAWLDHKIPHWGCGSSGLFGVTVAFHLGIDRTVLCGVPMESRGYVAPHDKWLGVWPQSEVDIHRPGWTYWADRMEGRVKSASGWTRELLGEPEPAWLDGH